MKREIWEATPFAVKLLLATSFMMNMGFYALIPYLTLHLTGSIGWSVAMAGLILGVRQFSQQGFAFLGGLLADKFGYKGTMVLGMFIRAVGFAMFAFCTETWHFFIAAIFSGLGGSLFEPAGAAAFAVLTPETIRKEVFAFRNVLSNIGVVGSQLIGTALVTLDFSYLSLIAGSLFCVSAILAFLLLPPIEAKNTQETMRDSIEHVFKDRSFIRYTIILMGYYYLYMQIFLTIPQLVEDVMHNKVYVGIVLSTISVSIILLQMKILHWLEGYTQRLTLIGLGTLVMSIGLFLLAFADTLWLLIIDAFIFALGTMISVPNLVDMVPRFAPKEHVAAYYGFNGYSLAIGGSIGQFVGGWVYDFAGSRHVEWLPWTFCLLIGILVAWKLHGMDEQMRARKDTTAVM